MRVPAPAIKHQLPKFCAGLNGTVSAPTFNWVVLFGLRTPIDVPGAINGSPGVAGSGGRCRSGSGCQAQAAVGHLVRLWTAAARGSAAGTGGLCRRVPPSGAALLAQSRRHSPSYPRDRPSSSAARTLAPDSRFTRGGGFVSGYIIRFGVALALAPRGPPPIRRTSRWLLWAATSRTSHASCTRAPAGSPHPNACMSRNGGLDVVALPAPPMGGTMRRVAMPENAVQRCLRRRGVTFGTRQVRHEDFSVGLAGPTPGKAVPIAGVNGTPRGRKQNRSFQC